MVSAMLLKYYDIDIPRDIIIISSKSPKVHDTSNDNVSRF